MFSFIANFAHNAEMRESKDEMLVGEIVRAMARQHAPAIEFRANDDAQHMRFRTVRDPVLYSVIIRLDRKTGSGALSAAVFGSKATLNITAQVRNNISDPDDLIAMYKTDLANLFKMPVLGGVKLNHALNSVFATTQQLIEIDHYIGKGDAGAQKLTDLLGGTIGTLREKLAPYNKTAAR